MHPVCVFLDKFSIDCNDLDLSAITTATELTLYDRSSADEVISRASNAEIIITNKVKLERTQIEQLPKLKLICVIATGTNNIDFQAAADHNIKVCNVKDYAAASVSQHVLMLILSLSSSFLKYQQDIKQGQWQNQDQFCLLSHPIQVLQDKTIGLIGYGHIAKAVENLAIAFGMKVLISRSISCPDTEQTGRLPLHDILKQSDFISLHCPLTDLSENLIGMAEFETMKKSAYIINTARGGIINEVDLLKALKAGLIAGAGLDCLSQEPPLPDDLLITAGLAQLIITPHNAWGTHQARQKLVDGTTENIINYISGKSRH
ncbi:MAG: D-2-hydroxyacid dehydrogenase [Gammaproteobacteria bacterium]|jgi:glycerate dehydrogenase|nr:D-2-hydroxyacid dehydrogenase [Gammaproteobacteria bacterium]MBT7045382.1 D-2-hydroxyacid dehydrogenase [Gammaproteobacteria bacterium]